MLVVLALGVLAQGADAVTMRLSHEANPLVAGLGLTAYLAKILLVVGVTMLAWSLPRLPTGSRRWLRQMAALSLAWLLLAVGSVGALSNLWARLGSS